VKGDVIIVHAAATPAVGASIRMRLDPAMVDAGTTVAVPARIENPTDTEQCVVLLVQGLPGAWCPPAQVVQLGAGAGAEVTFHLTPPLGTTPGRYLWTLTAESPEAPLQAADSVLTVRRPPATRPPAPPRRRRHRSPVLVALTVVVVLIALIAVKVALREPEPVRPLSLAALLAEPERAANVARMNRPPGPVRVAGTVFLTGDAPARPVRATVFALSLANLSGADRTLRRTGHRVRIRGNDWTADLPSGLYLVRFRSPGHRGGSVVVETLTSARTTLDPVRLSSAGTRSAP
jgi:hypothetical protein